MDGKIIPLGSQKKTARRTGLPRFTPLRRMCIGLAALMTETPKTALAAEFGCGIETIEGCASDVLKAWPGYSYHDQIHVHQAYRLRGMRRYFQTLLRSDLRRMLSYGADSVPGSMSLTHCRAHFRCWNEAPELLIEHGCDQGVAVVRGLASLDALAERLDSFRTRARRNAKTPSQP